MKICRELKKVFLSIQLLFKKFGANRIRLRVKFWFYVPDEQHLVDKTVIDDIKGVEVKPPLINQHCIVYKFSCDLCDTDYVGYTSRHLFQCIAEHKYSAIGKQLQEEHRLQPTNLNDQFTVLKKCRTKFDCLI